jgi:hypothetical protein
MDLTLEEQDYYKLLDELRFVIGEVKDKQITKDEFINAIDNIYKENYYTNYSKLAKKVHKNV